MSETAPEPVALDAVVTVTEPAARQITSMLAEDNENAGKALRVFVEAGGCSGMQYGMVFDETRDDDMRGAVIEFRDEHTGGGFKNNNPNAHASCGCGKSFSA